jgi:glucokinase
MKSYLSIDVGGSFLKSAVLNSGGDVFEESVFLVESLGESSREKIFESFSKVIGKGHNFIRDNNMDFGGIGVAFPGPFDVNNGISLMQHKFQSIYGIPLREVFYQMGAPLNAPITFIHDAHAVLAGELWKGNAKGFSNAAVITLGTGLGFALAVDGKIRCNALGGPILSIFKLSYNGTILEDYVSKRGVLRIYKSLNNDVCCDDLEVSDIGKMAENGDEKSISTFQKMARILAHCLKKILKEQKIECLLFGGQISRSFPFMEKTLQKQLKEVESLILIDAVQSIDYAAFWGALSTILQSEKAIVNK